MAVPRALPGVARGPALLRHRAQSLPGPPFTLGVASGDPLPDRVVLWTRLAPDPLAADSGLGGTTVTVDWEIAHDEAFADVVHTGRRTARPEDAYAVHVDAGRLEPDREYFYRFHVGSDTSPTGRTRTAPDPRSDGARQRFAFASCQHYEDGLFTAYRHLAAEDVGFVVFLGDYIYENAARPDGVRRHEGPEVFDIVGYRRRYALYKQDPDLQAAHAAFPWMVVWDDHEVDNNYAGDSPQNYVESPALFHQRRAAAYKAWWEHQPVRLPRPVGADVKTYRAFRRGRLLTVRLLDTRQYRSNQPCNSPFDIGPACPDVWRPDARMLGDGQERWLDRTLRRSRARWDAIAQQVMIGRLDYTPSSDVGTFDFDQWDGYRVPRQRLLDLLRTSGANPVVITGDNHSSWVNALLASETDPASPTVAPELVGTSITSRYAQAELAAAAIPGNPTVRFYDGAQHGYVACDVTPDVWRADFRYVSSLTMPDATIETGATFEVHHGDPEPRRV